MKHTKRLDAIERAAKPKKGQRLFVKWDTDGGRLTERGEPRTQKDVDDAERQGFDVTVMRVAYESRAGE